MTPPATSCCPALGKFLFRVVTDQAHIGAIAPTSGPLARRLAELVPPTPGVMVVELGAGTGTISAAVGPRLGPGARHIAVDRDPALLAALTQNAPWAQQLPGDVTDLTTMLAAAGVDTVDVVLSSLPWSNFAPSTRQQVLAQITTALHPAGVFATIAYRPTRLIRGARQFRTDLEASFADVRTSDTVWPSLPPARLLIGRRPRGY